MILTLDEVKNHLRVDLNEDDGLIKNLIIAAQQYLENATGKEYPETDSEGKEIDYANWTGKEVNGTTYPNLNQYRKDVAKTMIDRQSADADVITGATVSCQNWIIATQRALEKATK